MDEKIRYQGNINPHRGSFKPPRQMKYRLFTLKRNGPNKIYRLNGFTKTKIVEQNWRSRRRMQLFLRVAIFIVFIILLIILYYYFDPIPKIRDLIRLVTGGL